MSQNTRSILITPSSWAPSAGERLVAREQIVVEGIPLHLATLELPEAQPQPNDDEVEIRILAFSCNYRDKAWSLHLASEAEKHSRAFAFGSDFVGEITAVGQTVTTLASGDLVIGDNDYPLGGGLATQESSAGRLRLKAECLLKIPLTMDLTEAASFGVSAQTAYGMLRRSGISQAGEYARALVTAGTSSTSLAVLSALHGTAADVITISTSAEKSERLRSLHAGNVLVIPRENYAANLQAALTSDVTAHGPFTHVFDPFCDIHFPLVLGNMDHGGRYVTCGFFRQHKAYPEIEDIDNRLAWHALISRNLIVRGNCLGLRTDLETALTEYAAGLFSVPIDSVHPAEQPGKFLRRTYCDSEKFGKVVCQLNS